MKLQLANLFLLAGLLSFTAQAQTNTIVQTSLSAAITSAVQQQIVVASLTGLVASLQTQTVLLIDEEAILVLNVPSAATLPLTVQRGYDGTKATTHLNTSVVLAGRPDWFYDTDQVVGSPCTAAATYVTPYINIRTSHQFLCSTVTLAWEPGWNNTFVGPPGVTAAVASAAGQITPSGPLFHITGALAITGFLFPIGMGVGQTEGQFCVIPDGTFTFTTANNIAVAGTAVVNRLMCFIWDFTNLKWVPSYV
jgi:hypothetical protein